MRFNIKYFILFLLKIVLNYEIIILNNGEIKNVLLVKIWVMFSFNLWIIYSNSLFFWDRVGG